MKIFEEILIDLKTENQLNRIRREHYIALGQIDIADEYVSDIEKINLAIKAIEDINEI